MNLKTFANKRVLISAGPMRTEMDPVRYLQNRSSGKMGLEIALAAERLGATVSVLLGPVDPSMAEKFRTFEVQRYLGPTEYSDRLTEMFEACDIFFSLAAVLDFELVTFAKKMEREAIANSATLNIPMKPVPDFVAAMAEKKRADQIVIAFAAENGTNEEIAKRAHAKMIKKGVDAIVANPVRPGLGPEAEENELWILRPGKKAVHAGPSAKKDLALPLLETLLGSTD